MSDDRKLTLSDRPAAAATKPGETGKPRLGLGARRTKPVVVERKRRRILRKDGETPAPKPVVEESFSLKPKRPTEETTEAAESHLTSTERDARVEALQEAIRQAEQARMAAAEEKRQRDASAQKARQADEKQKTKTNKEDEALLKVEEDAKRKAEEESLKKIEAEAEAQKALEEEAKLRASEKSLEETKKERRIEEDKAHKKQLEKKRHANLKKVGGERRRGGKLTVAQALGGGDDYRGRSLAALKRAQAKQKRMLGGEVEKPKKSREVIVPEAITAQELANRMAEKVAAVMKVLINMGVMTSMNENLDQDTAELVVEEFGHTIKRVSESDVEIGLTSEDDDPKLLKPRPPVVTIMGHVDHGKTSLLDALRHTDVAAGEAGGITQHIGAYQVKTKAGNVITFLDTPGHEAFTQMRARGAQATDLVVLVVAADDSVMPQTIEAINHAKAAGVPMIIAINKMDKPGADANKVRNELLQHEVIVEAMSGDVLDVEVSAKTGAGLDKLEEAIQLQAELLDIKANPDRPAEGVVIEAELDKGKGPVATLLIQRGTLKIGDILVAGAEWGRVRALFDDKGKKCKEATPSMAVEVQGLNGTPSAGDSFAVVENDSRAREVSEYRKEQDKNRRVSRDSVSLENMFSALKENQAAVFPLIIKADVNGSAEAISSALEKIGNEEIRAQVIHSGVGAITESDVTLAQASNTFIIGFNVRANKQAREAAAAEKIEIRYYSVIYDVVDDVKTAMEGKLSPAIEETIIGLVEIKDVFSAGKKGKAAGCIVQDGIARANAKVRLLRDDIVVYTGKLESLRRFKDEVKEVKAGTECGISLENYIDFKAGDTIEVFETTEKQKKL